MQGMTLSIGKKKTENVLDVEYKIYDQHTRAMLIVREHIDVGPGITEIEMQEEDEIKANKRGRSVSVDDRDLPLLIEALQRRLADVSKEES